MRKFLISALIATSCMALSTSAFAHTAITQTSIPNGGSVFASPAAYNVTYGAPVRLATVELKNAAGQVVPLTFRPAPAPAGIFAIPLPRLAAGSYTMAFRAMGGDGHVMNNQTTFTIGAAAAAPAAPPVKGGMAGMNHSGGGMGGMAVTTSIANGAVLTASPRTITVNFPHAMALTSARLTTASGERVALQIPTSRTPTTSVAITLPRLDADRYSFVWGADAGDHNMSGTVNFQVR